MNGNSIDAIYTVTQWARGRADRSSSPVRYMNDFGDELRAVLNGVDILETRWDTSSPLHMAAEIEALSAARILAQWDQRHELTDHRPRRGPK